MSTGSIRRRLTRLATAGAIASALTGALAVPAEAANPDSRLGLTFDAAVHQVDETQNWGDEHQQTSATLFITYTYVENEDGDLVAKAVNAYINGSTTTWTDLKLAGFHATSQVKLGPQYFQTPQFRYGVDGQWIGVSKRTDPWRVDVPVKLAKADQADKGGTMDVDFSRG